MTELDFDELDKAVNNLMSGVDTTKRNAVADDPEDKVLTLDESTAAVVSDAAPTPVSSAPGGPAPSLAVKRRGQFMDVMHPSSDMKSTNSAAPARRQGITITPVSPASENESGSVEEKPVAVASETEQTQPQEPEPTRPEPQFEQGMPAINEADTTIPETSKSEWPDPIDLASSVSSDNEQSSESTGNPTSDTLIEDEQRTPETNASDPEPLSSPFLPDAKVEKRPLGALSDATDVQPIQQTGSDTAEAAVETSANNEPATDLQSPPPVQLPDELKSDIIALESSNTGETSSEQHADPGSTGASGQIPQQYSEQPRTDEQPSTAIYDTSTHTQPLEKPKKKSSTWKWIVWFLVLIIFSILGGAAYFYFTT